MHGPEIEIGLAALIPEDYMPDVHMRLVHYKRIANARTSAELDELAIELIDRFGLLPPPLKTLFAITALKLDPFNGPDLDRWDDQLGRARPGFLYLISRFQNPSGYCYRPAELERLIETRRNRREK